MGLLGDLQQQRECQRGHGAMNKQPGIWVLQQAERVAQGLIASNMPSVINPTGKLLTVYTYICPVCGHVELVNEG